jgi:hypothetical protein
MFISNTKELLFIVKFESSAVIHRPPRCPVEFAKAWVRPLSGDELAPWLWLSDDKKKNGGDEMTITEIKPAIVGSKKAVEAQVVNVPILEETEKRTKYQQVTAGNCPHDQASLLEPVKTKGVGIKLTCSQCGHTWYINKKIKTCGCLTCKGTRRSSMERAITHRIERRTAENDGGPLWTRTTDPSLISSLFSSIKTTY